MDFNWTVDEPTMKSNNIMKSMKSLHLMPRPVVLNRGAAAREEAQGVPPNIEFS